jgi:hypothetical protein
MDVLDGSQFRSYVRIIMVREARFNAGTVVPPAIVPFSVPM